MLVTVRMASAEKSDGDAVTQLENVELHKQSLNQGAKHATAQEHSYGVWEALKTYKRAAFWSIR